MNTLCLDDDPLASVLQSYFVMLVKQTSLTEWKEDGARFYRATKEHTPRWCERKLTWCRHYVWFAWISLRDNPPTDEVTNYQNQAMADQIRLLMITMDDTLLLMKRMRENKKASVL